MSNELKEPTPPESIAIAFCITELNVGGAERALVELAKRVDRSRFSATVYCLGRFNLSAPPTLLEELQQEKIPVRFLGAGSWLSFPRVLLQLWRHFRDERPQIVQTFLFHANFIGAIAARLAGVPIVLTGIRVAEPRKWHLRLARWASFLVDRHICVSQAVADYSRDFGRLQSSKLVVIPNGIDLKRFENVVPANLAELGVPKGNRVFTFVGRLEEQKGLDWLLPLLPRLFARVPNCDLLVVGDGPQRAMLEHQTNQSGIGDRVHFAGWRDDVPAILAASELLVLPSRWEGMPNVVLEAMASGKALVACDVEGITELLGTEASSQIVPPDDRELYLSRIAKLLENAELRSRSGHENRVRCGAIFSVQPFTEAYEHLFINLLRNAASAEKP